MIKFIKENILKKIKQPLAVVVLVVFLLFLLSRLLPIFLYGDVVFGYDTGIYRHFIEGYFERMGDKSITPFGFSAFSNFLRFFGESTYKIMYGWYFLFAFLTAVLFYFVIKKDSSQKIALISLALFTFSITQFEFYSWYYYRNFLALFFILLAILLIQNKSWLFVFPLVAIGIVHPISLVPIGLTIIILSFYPKRNWQFFLGGALALFAVIFINWKELSLYLSTLQNSLGFADNVANDFSSEFSGQFIDIKRYLLYSFIYIFFGIWGIIKFWKKYLFWSVFLLINIVLILIKVVFYNRFLVYLDVGIIFFASLILYDLYNFYIKHKIGKIIIFFYTFLLIGSFFLFFINKKPLINENEIQNIKSIEEETRGDFVLTISPVYAPWLYGFLDAKIIAPGMFEHNLWSRDKWLVFWSEPNLRAEFLSEYKAEKIYIFLGEKDRWFAEQLDNDKSFKKITDYLFVFEL